MLIDLVESYKLRNDNSPEEMIQVNHRPKAGIYIRLRLDQSWNEQLTNFDQNHYIIHLKDKDDITPTSIELYRWFQVQDYYSSLITMNKAVDGGKQIHSNNPFALFAKSEVFLGEKKDSKSSMEENITRFLTQTEPEIVIQKWSELINDKRSGKKGTSPTPEEFFAKSEYLPALQYLTSEYRKNQLINISDWFQHNLYDLTEYIRKLQFKNYVKLFFTLDTSPITSESQFTTQQIFYYEYLLYTIPKVYNSNDYNQLVNGEMTGLPGFNMSMNSKKPYLEHKSMGVVAPVRVSLNEAMQLKQASEWLLSQEKYVTNKFSYETSFSYTNTNAPEGVYHVYVEGKENEVISFENVPFPKGITVNIPIRNVLGIQDNEGFIKDYGSIDNVDKLQKEISSRFFRGRLNQDQGRFLHSDEPKPRAKDFTALMATLFMQSRQAFHDWLYKGTEITIRPLFAKVTLRLIEEQMMYVEPASSKGKQRTLELRWLADAMNIRLSMEAYLRRNEGGKTMADRITSVRNSLKEKLLIKDINICSNDDEFYFLAGQVAYYLKSQSEAQNKTGDLLGPFLIAKRSEQLKKRLEEAYIQHKHKVIMYNFKFNRAFASIFGYQPEQEVEGEAREMFIAGLFADNWFYEKDGTNSNEGMNENGEEN
ncbi:CRISPR-associated protein Csh1 [Fontibacillus solani]|uniref:CRISPR-associated protein Csh1 n=1 Tax=Fontibacillus solani TaxID=1572857 RepID=A0A7W3SPA1_9BACL|nr:hypothetical protein [Fontibacillus solani]MBA9083572.1 CRISPR-associated protein Csh1 [Fontibacillus solani]